MADSKISALTAITGVNTATDDVFPIVDTSVTTTKKITRAELAVALSGSFATAAQGATADSALQPSGTAAKATILETTRTIDGVSFNGSANITVVAPATHAATEKTVLVAADEIAIADSAASYALKKATMTDLKAMLKAAGFAYSLYGGAIPSGIAPSGTMAVSGVFTLGTALNFTYSAGIWLYFPADALSSGSAAGSYWCVMSSTTIGTVYTATLDALWPYVPSSPTIATTTVQAWTGSTSLIVLATGTVPANSMGPTGHLESIAGWGYNNTGNTKTSKFNFGGTDYLNASLTTSVAQGVFNKVINRGVTNKQIGLIAAVNTSGFGTTSGTPATSTVDTTADVTIYYKGQLATATDFFILESNEINIHYGA